MLTTLYVIAAEQEYGPALRARIEPLIVGIGPIDAAITLASHLRGLADADVLPDRVVSLGSAGSQRRPVGSVWQIAGVSWRDMDATALGFERGVTPFCDQPAMVPLAVPLADVPLATLSTGADVLSGDGYARIDTDLCDMETYAIARTCRRFGVPLAGYRAVSDGPGELSGVSDWTGMLHVVDARLAEVVDLLERQDLATATPPP